MHAHDQGSNWSFCGLGYLCPGLPMPESPRPPSCQTEPTFTHYLTFVAVFDGTGHPFFWKLGFQDPTVFWGSSPPLWLI